MFGEMNETLLILSSLSPIAIIGLLSWIVFLLVHRKGPIKVLTENHIQSIYELLSRMDNTLLEIRDGINYLKGRRE